MFAVGEASSRVLMTTPDPETVVVSLEETNPDLGGLRRKERLSRDKWSEQGPVRKCGRLTG